MSRYHRNREGSVCFFTEVTHRRRPILTTEIGRRTLRNAITEVRSVRPFELLAIVLLPDHLHTIWELPYGDSDDSTRWRQIKSLFTKARLTQGGTSIAVNHSRIVRAERGIWQRLSPLLQSSNPPQRPQSDLHDHWYSNLWQLRGGLLALIEADSFNLSDDFFDCNQVLFKNWTCDRFYGLLYVRFR